MRCSREAWPVSGVRPLSSISPAQRVGAATGSPSSSPRSSMRCACSPARRPRTARRDRRGSTPGGQAKPARPLMRSRQAGAFAQRFASLVKIEHTVFALPFAYVGAFLAVDGSPGAHDLVWITLAMVGARSLAMALNRLIDIGVDARNPRTARRELPSGSLSIAQVAAFCVAALALFLV